MTEPTQIKKSARERRFERVACEEFNAFERREYYLRMEERKERVAQLRLRISNLGNLAVAPKPGGSSDENGVNLRRQ